MHDRTNERLVRDYGLLGQSCQRSVSRCEHCLADQGESVIGEGPDGGGMLVGDI